MHKLLQHETTVGAVLYQMVPTPMRCYSLEQTLGDLNYQHLTELQQQDLKSFLGEI